MSGTFASLLSRDIAARRISVELVREAYTVSDLRPMSGKTLGLSCGCPIAAIWAAKFQGDEYRRTKSRLPTLVRWLTAWADSAFDHDYVRSFAGGFDRTFFEQGPGYADGRAARQAVLGASA